MEFDAPSQIVFAAVTAKRIPVYEPGPVMVSTAVGGIIAH